MSASPSSDLKSIGLLSGLSGGRMGVATGVLGGAPVGVCTGVRTRA